MVSIATLFREEIEIKFRNHLPKDAYGLIQVMADQMLEMEAALNSQREIVQKLMKYVVLSHGHQAEIMAELARHDKRFDNSPITEKVEDPDGSIN